METVMVRAIQIARNAPHLPSRCCHYFSSLTTHGLLTTGADDGHVLDGGAIRSSVNSHGPAHKHRFHFSSNSESYASPFQDIFDRMKINGPTALGTTQEIVEIEKAYEMNRKKLDCGIPENVLRFSSTAYGRTLLAPFVHPNEHRVIMKLNTKHLPFHPGSYEYEILREIVGDRLNDERTELRLTSNKFGSRIENKRHLVSMLDRIISSCQKLASEINQDSEIV